MISYEVKDRIASITLNRPDKRNALNAEMVEQLYEAFERAEQDKEVKVIVLQAEGKAFCSGADLASLQEMQNYSLKENIQDSRRLMELYEYIYTLPKVVIAAVQGHALAGGCGLTSVCDFAFAAENIKMGYTEVKIGFIPAIVKVFLLRKIGETKAKELLLTGKLISASQAKEYGLINEVVSADELKDYVNKFAKELCENNSGQAMGLTKTLIAEVQSMDLQEALNYAAESNAKARSTEDCKKGIAAFLNKKDLKW
ncbi:MAG: enoyl-CoA hydratase/isomerase family protein [Cyclobacteriaceae bacterium]|nr:enoyl-CoA hydratase/isomerase family protein [Cyclobacteriaceae bacterium]MCH8517044.1 enoyl-CoA hydratase/isomerase family protein [Cyclobacteriaceae bacterium]